ADTDVNAAGQNRPNPPPVWEKGSISSTVPTHISAKNASGNSRTGCKTAAARLLSCTHRRYTALTFTPDRLAARAQSRLALPRPAQSRLALTRRSRLRL